MIMNNLKPIAPSYFGDIAFSKTFKRSNILSHRTPSSQIRSTTAAPGPTFKLPQYSLMFCKDSSQLQAIIYRNNAITSKKVLAASCRYGSYLRYYYHAIHHLNDFLPRKAFYTSSSCHRSLDHRKRHSIAPAKRRIRYLHTSAPALEVHFDTHHFVQRLEREGLNRAQAESIMNAMADVIDESIRNMTGTMITRADHEKHLYTQRVDFTQLKSELQLMEKNDLSMMKAETDRLLADVEKLRQRLREEVTRTQAGVRLDLNLEKGRMREEAAGQELKIREVDTRIEREIAELRTAIQASKATTLQYVVGFVTGCSALLMAYLRFRL